MEIDYGISWHFFVIVVDTFAILEHFQAKIADTFGIFLQEMKKLLYPTPSRIRVSQAHDQLH